MVEESDGVVRRQALAVCLTPEQREVESLMERFLQLPADEQERMRQEARAAQEREQIDLLLGNLGAVASEEQILAGWMAERESSAS